MKKKRLVYFGIIVTLMSGLTACGKNEAATKIDANSIFDENAKENTKETTETKADENKQENQAGTTSTDEMACYENFLNDKEPVYFDKAIESTKEINFLYDNGINLEEVKGKPYTFSEMVKLVCTAKANAYWDRMEPQSISYGYIDCGMDGKKELVIFLEGLSETKDMNDMYIISLIDNKLQIVYNDYFGYRSYGQLNENGYYVRGGSSGAAVHNSDSFYINENGDVKLDFYSESVAGAESLYIPDNDDYLVVANEQGVDGNILIDRYSFTSTKTGQDYIDYLKESTWTYYATDNNYNEIISDEYYKEDNPYRIFWDSTGLPLSKPNEVNVMISEHRKQMGIPEKALEGKEVEKKVVSDEMLQILTKWQEDNDVTSPDSYDIILENPSQSYYNAGNEEAISTMVNLAEKSCVQNEIIDTDKWFSKNGFVKPDLYTFSDSQFTYIKNNPCTLEICTPVSNIQLYSLDFSNYYYSESFLKGNEFTNESIGYAMSVDDTLYVSTFHWTYAADEPSTGYITAFDMKDNFKVKWKSQPLTCNCQNFEIIDNTIICGYGFTDEDDFLYVLDRNTGKRMHEIKLKSAPEFIFKKDNELYVRTYNTDYVFDIVY